MKNLMKKIVVMMAIMCVVLTSCTTTTFEAKETQATLTQETQATQVAQEKATHTVIDHAGNEVEVPNEVNRIVIADIYPMASVISVFFNSAEKIVGMAPPIMSAAKNSMLVKLYPELLLAKTDFIDGTNINIEEVMNLQPDVVFYSAGSKATGEKLKKAGIAGIAISPAKWHYDAIETLNKWIETLEAVFGTNNNRATLVQEYSKKVYGDIQNRTKNLTEEEKAKVFFLFKYSDTDIMTSGKNFFGQYWCDAINAKNVAEDLTTDNQIAVNMEQVYSWNPDNIFITNFTTATPENLYNNDIGNYNWSSVAAIEKKQVYKMPLGVYRTYTCGVDTPITLYWIAKQVYKDLFDDIDIVQITKDYYKKVFDIDLTDEEADLIFNPNKMAASNITK